MRTPEQIQALTARGQAAARALMTDTVKVWRPTGETTTNGRGKAVDELRQVYGGPDGGPAKAQNDAAYPSSPDLGGIARVTARVAQVHFPHGTDDVQTGDLVEFVGSRNPRLVGVWMRLRSDEDKTWTTAVRMNVQEVLRGGPR
ncbi:DUF6093 family protein [Brachybacterium sp. DNPG3]